MSFNYNNQPTGMLQANRAEGYTTRSVAGAIQTEELSRFQVPIIIGTSSGAAGAAPGQEWGRTAQFSRELANVSDIYLNQIQFKSVQNVSSGDGFCRIRLKIAETEILENLTAGNAAGVSNGFIVLLESATGTLTFNPPVLVKHFKNKDGTFTQNSTLQIGLLDETGTPRGFQKLMLLMSFDTKYYQ